MVFNFERTCPVYTMGNAIPANHFIFWDRIVPISIYQGLNLGAAANNDNNQPASARTIKLPMFSGKDTENLRSWLATVESRFKLHQVDETIWVQETATSLEGAASEWFNGYLAHNEVTTWNSFKEQITTRFGTGLSTIVVARMWDNLKQTGSVEEYIIEHQKICAQASEEVQCNENIVNYIFLKNLNTYVSKYIRDEDFRSLEDTYCEARAVEQKSKAASAAYNKRKNQNKGKWNQKRPHSGNDSIKNNSFSNNSKNNNN